MQTGIVHKRGRIQLIIDDPSKARGKHDVVAAMDHYEGTNCWELLDLRLTKHRTPGPYACSPVANVFCASYKPETKEEADFIKSRLREFQEQPDGEILWCTFDGVVRGAPDVNGYKPPQWGDFNQAGYFSRADGLAKLNEIKEFWDGVDDLDSDWRIENPNRQPSLIEITAKILFKKLDMEEQASADKNNADEEQSSGMSAS
jgi:hypothetical protein